MDEGKQVVKSESSSGIFKKIKLWGNKKASDEETIDMEQQFELFSKVFENIKLGKIYGKSPDYRDFVFRHMSKRKLSCTDENQEISFTLVDDQLRRDVLNLQSSDTVRKGYGTIHMGAIMIAVKGLQRSNPPGTKTFVVLYDERHMHAEQGILGTFEIDMSKTNGAVIYFCPDDQLVPQDFVNSIKVGIKTKGYQLLQGEDNLMIRIGFIGRRWIDMATPLLYKINSEMLGKMLVNKGVKAAVAGREYSGPYEQIACQEWRPETFYDQKPCTNNNTRN